MSAAPAIRIRGLWKSFGPQTVIRDLSLEVPRGEVTVVIGLSGAGKSVLLKLMMGLHRPDKGSIEIGEQEITTLRPRELRELRSRFGYVFQDGALFDSMDVFENVAFPLREHAKWSEARIRARVMECLELVGLEAAGHKMPSNLSGGMRKRASLARALVRKPEFLLYDEPTTGLDPIRTASIDQLIADTQSRNPNMTSVVITHDMAAVFRIAHKVAMLLDGAIIAEGVPEDFRRSSDARVRQFIEGDLEGPISV